MSTGGRLIVVSGASRGVGVGICRQALKLDATADVVVTARNLDRAKEIRNELAAQTPSSPSSSPSSSFSRRTSGATMSAVSEDKVTNHGLEDSCCQNQRVHAYQCDVTDEKSCASLVDMLLKNGLLSLPLPSVDDYQKDTLQQHTRPLSLINNAGVALDLPWIPGPWPSSTAHDTLNVNLYGAERLTRAFLPHLLNSSDGRIIFVSSGAGRANMKKMDEIPRSKLQSEDLTWNDVQIMADAFQKEYESAAIAAVSEEVINHKAQSLPFLSSQSGLWLQSYGFSKACLGAYCQILARKYTSLFSVACSPGFIQTDMTRQYSKYDELKSVEEGGEVEAWLATTEDKESMLSGVFYQPDRSVVSWVADDDNAPSNKDSKKAGRRLTTLISK